MEELITEPGIAGKFIKTAFDENGVLNHIEFEGIDRFNFAFDIMDPLAEKYPKKTAMLHISKHGKERFISFADMKTYSNRTANYLTYLGVKKGDRVLLVLKRNYQFWFTILALHKIGAVAVPASFLLTRKDFEYRFKTGEITTVIASSDGDICSEIDRAVKNCTFVKNKITVGNPREGWHTYNKEVKMFSADFNRTEETAGGDDPMLMFFTSGTTSYPKMALHSYKYPLGHYITARFWHQVDPNGIHFAISDTGWGKALWGKLYGQWLCEGTVFTYDYTDFYAKEIVSMLEKYKITTFCAPPTVYRVLVHLDLSKYDLSHLQNVTTAGEALNPEIFRKFYEATGLKIMEGFGQTETTLTIGNLNHMEPRPGSMGKPSPMYDIHVLRTDGSECDIDETGEICVDVSKGFPCGLFLGYYNDQERTNQVIHDGFYHTGDTAYLDKDGYLWYVGRVDDIIKSAGYRVGPFEIENEIMKIPYVLECAVTSVPDKIRGQAIKASIVLTEGTEGTDQLKKEVMHYLKANLASYKRPKIIDFVKELPKTTSGKVRRVEIKENDWKKETSNEK